MSLEPYASRSLQALLSRPRRQFGREKMMMIYFAQLAQPKNFDEFVRILTMWPQAES